MVEDPRMRTNRRITCLCLAGVLTMGAALAVQPTTLANWMTPSHLRPRTTYAFEASRDGRWVRAETFRPGEPFERRVLEIATGREVDATAGELDARFPGLAQPWYRRTQVGTADGRTAVTISWPARVVERSFTLDRHRYVHATSREGHVFEHLHGVESFELLCHDLVTGESRLVVRSNPNAGAIVSPDGERVLLNEDGLVSRKRLPEHRGVKILDAHDGSQLGWIEAPWSVTWIGDAHRYVQTELDGHLTVLDLERGTRVALETHHSTMEHVEVLPDGNLLLQDGDELVLCDGTSGAVLRRY